MFAVYPYNKSVSSNKPNLPDFIASPTANQFFSLWLVFVLLVNLVASPITPTLYTSEGAPAANLLSETAVGTEVGGVASSSNLAVTQAGSDYILKLEPTFSEPNPLSSTVVLTATLYQHDIVILTHEPVSLVFSAGEAGWPGIPSYTSVQNAAGQWVFTYTRSVTTTDYISATAQVDGTTISSKVITVVWQQGFAPVTMTPVQGHFYTLPAPSTPNQCVFNKTAADPALFGQTFPSIYFDGGGPSYNRPQRSIFATTLATTNATELYSVDAPRVLAQGNGYQAGVGELSTFQAAFRGSVIVAASGSFVQRFRFYFNTYGRFGFGVNHNGKGVQYTVVGTTSNQGTLTTQNVGASGLSGYPGMFSWVSNPSSISNFITVDFTFPEAGVYPFELDYAMCDPDYSRLFMGFVPQSQSNGLAVDWPPNIGYIYLEPGKLNRAVGQSATFTATLKDGSNIQPVDGVPVYFNINSVNGMSKVLTQTTNAQGVAVFSYTSSTPGLEYVQAVSPYKGVQIVSRHSIVTVDCNPQIITSPTDDGLATTCGTLSYALDSINSGTITFGLTGGGNTITFSGSLAPGLKAGVAVDGGLSGVIVNGNGVGGDGLRLSGGNTLTNLTIRNFAGHELLATLSSAPNHLFKVNVQG